MLTAYWSLIKVNLSRLGSFLILFYQKSSSKIRSECLTEYLSVTVPCSLALKSSYEPWTERLFAFVEDQSRSEFRIEYIDIQLISSRVSPNSLEAQKRVIKFSFWSFVGRYRECRIKKSLRVSSWDPSLSLRCKVKFFATQNLFFVMSHIIWLIFMMQKR